MQDDEQLTTERNLTWSRAELQLRRYHLSFYLGEYRVPISYQYNLVRVCKFQKS